MKRARTAPEAPAQARTEDDGGRDDDDEDMCRGFEVHKEQVLSTLNIDETTRATTPEHVVARSPACTFRPDHASQFICPACITTRNTYRRYVRTIAHMARDKFDSSLEDLVAMSKFQLLHKMAARMAIVDKTVKEEKKKFTELEKATFSPLAATMRYLENENMLPESCFFYKFLYVTLHYWRRIMEKGARGWVWDRCKYGTEFLSFFIGLRKLEGGRRVCRYLISENDKPVKSRVSGPAFDPNEIRLPIPPLPTIEARITQENKDKQRDALDDAASSTEATPAAADPGVHQVEEHPHQEQQHPHQQTDSGNAHQLHHHHHHHHEHANAMLGPPPTDVAHHHQQLHQLHHQQLPEPHQQHSPHLQGQVDLLGQMASAQQPSASQQGRQPLSQQQQQQQQQQEQQEDQQRQHRQPQLGEQPSALQPTEQQEQAFYS